MNFLKGDGLIVKQEPVTSPNPYLAVGVKSPHYSRTPSPQGYQPVQLQGAVGLAPCQQPQFLGGLHGPQATYISAGNTTGGHVYAPSYYPTTSQQPAQPQPPQAIPVLPQPPIGTTTSLLNMDTQECSLQELNSKDLAEMQILDIMTNSLTQQLTLSEMVQHHQQQQQLPEPNNTDSFTRLANSAINDLCNNFQ